MAPAHAVRRRGRRRAGRRGVSGTAARRAAPPGWHPEITPRTVPPRRLPELDHEAIDLAEERADRFTNVLGIVAGVVLILIACVQWRT